MSWTCGSEQRVPRSRISESAKPIDHDGVAIDARALRRMRRAEARIAIAAAVLPATNERRVRLDMYSSPH